MITFNTLKIENDKLYIDAEFEDSTYYSNMYITYVKIATESTLNASATDTGSNYITVYSNEDTNDGVIDTTVKGISLELSESDLSTDTSFDIHQHLFFVFVSVGGVPAPDCPCDQGRTFELKAVYSKCPLYNEALGYVRELANTCEPPKGFINAILKIKALDYALETKHYNQAAAFYSKFFSMGKLRLFGNVFGKGGIYSVIPHRRGCGCHG